MTATDDTNRRHWQLMEDSLRTMEQSAELLRHSSDLVSALYSYRMYLLDSDGDIAAAESFLASKDDDAADVARSVFEASNDVFSGYELWTGKQCISSATHSALARRTRHAAVQKHQQTVLDLEERLHKAFACVRRSRRLLAASKGIRDRVKASEAPVPKPAKPSTIAAPHIVPN
jgi:hypothetical protein